MPSVLPIPPGATAIAYSKPAVPVSNFISEGSLWLALYLVWNGDWVNGLNPRTAELFQLTFAAKGGCCNPPLDFGLPDRISS